MNEKADFIIIGNVTRIHNYTFTYVTIAITEFVTNPQNMSQITITIGGELQHAGELSRDSFEVGEKVFVFVERIGPFYRVMSGEAGKYRVQEGPPHVSLTFTTVINNWSTPIGYHPRLVFNESMQDLVSSGSTVDDVLTVVAVVLIFILLLAYLRWREKI